MHLTVGGPGAAHGRFTVAGGRVTGRLGGEPIAVATHPPAARRAARAVDGFTAATATAPHPRLARIP
jgi:hypothetical protein